MSSGGDLVSVVIPAFNSEATLDETLRSARGQTYRNLEIIVVDDGSTDGTAAVAEAHADADERVRVVSQANKGLAGARNSGIDASRGFYIAPLDADDLWRADKIERQLAALRVTGAGLAYCWQAVIDSHGRVIRLVSRFDPEGRVLDALCMRNFVGSGSVPLIARDALDEAGGYDEGLKVCEDYDLYFRIAEHHDFVLVRDFLVGYRTRPDSLSTNFERMIADHGTCIARFTAAHPEKAAVLRRNRTRLMRFIASRSWRSGDRSLACRLLWRRTREDPLGTMETLIESGRKRFKRDEGPPEFGSELLGNFFPIGADWQERGVGQNR